METLAIVLGTRNQAKRRGVARAFALCFPGTGCTLETMAAESGVSPLPLSEEECLSGARTRAAECRIAFARSDFCIGVESGLRRVSNDYLAMTTYAVILEKAGEFWLGASSSHVIARASEFCSAEFAGQFISGRESISELTRGAYGLADKTAEATLCALAMRVAFRGGPSRVTDEGGSLRTK